MNHPCVCLGLRKIPAGVAALILATLMAGCSPLYNGTLPTNRYALVIGIEDYVGLGETLPGCDKDASDMGTALANAGWQVTRLISTDAPATYPSTVPGDVPTYATIQSYVAQFATWVAGDRNASILVYYSGHGLEVIDGNNNPAYSDSRMGALIPCDWDGTPATHEIAADTIAQWLGAIDCRNRILVLDSCFSGNHVQSTAAIDLTPENTLESGTADASFLTTIVTSFSTLLQKSLSKTAGNPSVVTLSAAGTQEESYGGSSGGVFTTALIDSITNGDADKDGFITATEACHYAYRLIQAYWNPYVDPYNANPALRTNPFLPHISGGNGDFVLFKAAN